MEQTITPTLYAKGVVADLLVNYRMDGSDFGLAKAIAKLKGRIVSHIVTGKWPVVLVITEDSAGYKLNQFSFDHSELKWETEARFLGDTADSLATMLLDTLGNQN